MVKIVVMSDNHGKTHHIENIYLANQDADYFIHCGDFEDDDIFLEKFISVSGNNDIGSSFPKNQTLEIEGYKIEVCHGNQFDYYERTFNMYEYAKQQGIDILISGHTHIPNNECIDHIHLINPGSTARPRSNSKPSYAILWLDQGSIHVEFQEYIEN